MSRFKDIVGQEQLKEHLQNAIRLNKVSHAYLFETNNYENGFDLALAFAKYLLCPNHFSNTQNCNNCLQCSIIDKNDYLWTYEKVKLDFFAFGIILKRS